MDEKGPEIGRMPKKDERVKEWHGAMRWAGSKGKEKRREKGRRVARDGECKGRCLATLPCNDT